MVSSALSTIPVAQLSSPSLTVSSIVYSPSTSGTMLASSRVGSDMPALLPAGASMSAQLKLSGSPSASVEPLPSRTASPPTSTARSPPASQLGGVFGELSSTVTVNSK